MAMHIEKSGINLAAIYRPLNNYFLNPTMEKIRKKFICEKQIKKGVSGTKEILKHFKSGTSIALMIDQRVSQGIKSKFFNKDALTTTIPAQFVKKFNCKIVPIFIERNDVHPLLPFTGDVIYEGRWGNSIRLGSTARYSVSSSLNPWSNYGKNGEPITIIRNGQNVNSSDDEGWTPITEDINFDSSSIYLTNDQQIPISVASKRYFSYTPSFKEIPISPTQYVGNQIIISGVINKIFEVSAIS